MSKKPTLGYPSRTEAVLALREQGISTKEIAKRIGIATSTVVALEHSAGCSPKRAERPSEKLGRTIVVPIDVLDTLKPHATKRGISVNALVRRIVETVSDDDLVDGVLDDLETENA